MKLLGLLAAVLLYMEVVYHVSCFGITVYNPVYTLALIAVLASAQALIISFVKMKWKMKVFWTVLCGEYLLFAAQIVYLGIFKQPLLWEAVVKGGQDALTNYWREALAGIIHRLPFLLLLIVPLFVLRICLKNKVISEVSDLERLRLLFGMGVGIVLAVSILLIGKYIDADFYEEYSEFYDPLSVAEQMGVLPMVQRDLTGSFGMWISHLFTGDTGTQTIQKGEEIVAFPGDILPSAQAESKETEEEEKNHPKPQFHQLPIDFQLLKEGADSKETTWLAEYMSVQTPSSTNEYTGLFQGYNLIYITAEGFSPYAVSKELTPILYRLVHAGFDFANYYVPLWQTSTSDGEYVNCTGLIPDGQFSMRKSSSNQMLFTLPRYFAAEGVKSIAYHNNSLSYYDRHITHNNLGYVFKASKPGNLNKEEWGEFIFPMENPDSWPASDLEMIQGTVSEYINKDRFHVYYLTISGHMNYNFKGNAMSYKNREIVENLEFSETARAYIACQIELEKALEYLINELELAGKLENTVICLSSDHYPYGMDRMVYEELAGRPLSDSFEIYRNNLILWNIQLEDNPIVIDKVCGSMDILPTLLNLFGFSYDSRLYAGRDIFSDEEGIVIFNDRSFITDSVIYNRKTKQADWKLDPGDGMQEYLEQKQQEVKERYQFSAYILRNDYYRIITQALSQSIS